VADAIAKHGLCLSLPYHCFDVIPTFMFDGLMAEVTVISFTRCFCFLLALFPLDS